MSYLGELRQNVRPLAAAAIGSASGLTVAAYTTSIFSPYLIERFHWSRAQFSLIGLTILAALVVMPIVGRLTDRFGVRPMALAGTLLLPLAFIGYSVQDGRFGMFVLGSIGVLVFGSLTSPTVYTRLIAENFVRARGLALFIVTGAPALMGAILPRVLIAVNDAWGWRVGYRVLAAYFLIGGLIAVALVPKHEPGLDRATRPVTRASRVRQPGAAGEILRTRTFWIICTAMLLCALPTQLHAAQMMVMLGAAGLAKTTAANAVSAFAIGALIGRGVCGLALDRFAARTVAALSMVLPALGYATIALVPGAVSAITLAMLLVGLSYGAENDLPAFLVAKYFRIQVFSSALALVFCGVLFAGAGGAAILSLVLKLTDSFRPFLLLASATVLAGSLLFLALPREGRGASLVPADPAPA
ncbi:MAG: MFS transporter [Novosphingobium sp.]|nr:MFS transporter [Novosphingobium sp.]